MKDILKDMGVHMKVKTVFAVLLYCCIFAFLFCSCDLLLDIVDVIVGGEGGSSGGVSNPTNVLPRKFWAYNISTDNFYQLEAELLAEGPNCRVWAEKGRGITTATANSMVKAYEERIRTKMLDTFAYKGQIGFNGKDIGPIDQIENGEVVANDTLELAGWMTDDDGKLTLLLLDIKDDFKQGVNDGYVAGYFWSGNIVSSSLYSGYSNKCSMIYVDTYPAEPGSENSNSTVAHELQHLMTYVNAYISDKEYLLNTWIDEGLSSAAEWLYFGKQVDSKLDMYNANMSGLIQKGNNFFVWGNHESESQYAAFDDYSTVYLFFQWLRLQSGSTSIYKEITLSNNYNHLAVTNAANRAMSGNGYDNWGTLLKTWLAANYINAPSGPYGYRNDSVLKRIKAKTAPVGVTNISLAPGEGVYSITNDFDLPENKQSIRYAGLDKDGNDLSDTETFSGGALLTYNVNTNIEGNPESGTTTGVAASYAEADATSRSVAGLSFSGPYVIDAGGILRRNGFEQKPFFELIKPTKGVTILE
jgi:hypothetical protein